MGCLPEVALEKGAPGSPAINKGTECIFLFHWGTSLGMKHTGVFAVAPYVKSGIVITWIPRCPEGVLTGDFPAVCLGSMGWPWFQEVKMWFRKVQRAD